MACGIALYAGVCMAQDFAGGSGTAADPYLIKTPQQLSNLRNYLGSTHANKHFKLGNDIDLSAFCLETWGTAGWEPIGTAGGWEVASPFTGQLDGDGHKLSGLWINRERVDYIGLFGATSGTVKNLSIATDDARGGIKGSSYVGGLAGQNRGEIVNCHAAALISGRSSVGGLIGRDDVGSVDRCSATGDVSASAAYSGGLIGGTSPYSNITNCYATGDVSASSSASNSSSGGLIGNGNGSITNCYATGDVSAASSYYSPLFGGLIGTTHYGSNITNCYAAGKVKATGEGISYPGSLIGFNDRGSILNCYFLKESGIDGIGNDANNSNVIGLTAEQMKSRGSFPSFNFNTDWGIHEGWTYPYLQGVGSDTPGSPLATMPVGPDKPAVRMVVTDGTLTVSGLSAGERIAVYNIQGQLIYSGRVSGEEQQIALPAKGVYIVTGSGWARKIVL
jgi:hypothetical protein